MKIKLYQCLCENNRMNKESFLFNEIVLEGNAKNPINKSNPVIYVEDIPTQRDIVTTSNVDVTFDDDIDISFTSSGQAFNYMYIEEWGRYYFIEPITHLNNKLYTISGTIDTLMSFKNKEWKNNPLYITRRSKGNPLIADNLIQFKFNKKVLMNNGETISDTEAIKKGYDIFGIPYGNYSTYNDTYCVVVAVSNARLITTLQGFSNYLFIPKERDNGTDKMKKASSNMSFSFRNTIYYVITPRMLSYLCNYIIAHSSLSGYILSVTILPYIIATENTYSGKTIEFYPEGTLDFTDYGFSAYSVKQAKFGNNDRFIYRTIEIPEATSYRDFEPHTEAYMYIPYADTIKLNLQSVRGCKLRLYYYTDFDTSNSTYILYNVTKDKIENTGSCQLGYKVNLTTTNAEEIKRAQENNLTNFLFGTIASGVSLMSGNPMGAIMFGRSLISSMGQYITRENSLINKGQANATSSNVGSMLPLDVYIEWYIDEMTFTEQGYEQFVKNIGLPFNDYEYIYNIDNGEHVIVGDTSDVTMSSDVTSDELENFKNILASGFYK